MHDDFPSADPSLSRELVTRIQGGDESAWEELYLRYRDPLIFAIRCRLGARLRTRLDSEDILHSVFREALSDLHRFEPRAEHALHRYLHVCVLNKIRKKAEFFGAKKRAGAVPLSDSILARVPGSGDGLPEYQDHERYLRLETAVATLPKNLREVLLLRTVDGLDNQGAAREIGKTPEATSKLFNRAIARLAVQLGP